MIFIFRESSLIGSEFLCDWGREREAQALRGTAIMGPARGQCKEVSYFPQYRDQQNSSGDQERGSGEPRFAAGPESSIWIVRGTKCLSSSAVPASKNALVSLALP